MFIAETAKLDLRQQSLPGTTETCQAAVGDFPRNASVDRHFDGAAGAPAYRFIAEDRISRRSNIDKQQYSEISIELDTEARALWCMMRPEGRPSVTPGLLRDVTSMQSAIRTTFAEADPNAEQPFRYFVVGSHTPGIFNLGGDLMLFANAIRAGDRGKLQAYAYACVDVVYNNAVSYDQPIVTIAMVQGDALGGGFETALSCNVIVAERSAKFGLPEVLFNLFPGMGAYSLLSRRLDAVRAEKMILSGRIYTASELHDMGIVDVLAEDGQGEEAVRDYILRTDRKHNALQAVYKTRQRVAPVTLSELRDIADIWVAAALRLTSADLRKMERLVSAQDRRRTNDAIAVAAE
jgi:DSF synthase